MLGLGPSVSRSHLQEKMAGIQVDHLLSSLTAPISDFLLRIVSYALVVSTNNHKVALYLPLW